MRACVCVCVCACARARARACTHACLHASMNVHKSLVGIPHKSSAALPRAPAEHLHEPTIGPFQGPAQSFQPTTGQFILTNRKRHVNPADRIKRGHLADRHPFIHSVVDDQRRHIKKEETTPDCLATTPRGPGTTAATGYCTTLLRS